MHVPDTGQGSFSSCAEALWQPESTAAWWDRHTSAWPPGQKRALCRLVAPATSSSAAPPSSCAALGISERWYWAMHHTGNQALPEASPRCSQVLHQGWRGCAACPCRLAALCRVCRHGICPKACSDATTPAGNAQRYLGRAHSKTTPLRRTCHSLNGPHSVHTAPAIGHRHSAPQQTGQGRSTGCRGGSCSTRCPGGEPGRRCATTRWPPRACLCRTL